MCSCLSRDALRKLFGLPTEQWPLDIWIDQHHEEAIEPDMAIIDPHHHLWDARSQPKGWPIPLWLIKVMFCMKSPAQITDQIKGDAQKKEATGVKENGKSPLAGVKSFGMRQLPFIQPYMGPELTFDIGNRGSGKRGHNVVQTVYLECGWAPSGVEAALQPLGEVLMAESVHAAHPKLCNGIVAYANLCLPDVEKTLEAYRKISAVKGIRCSLAYSDDPEILGAGPHIAMNTANSSEFRRGFALLEQYGLSYDVWMFHEQLPNVTQLVRDFPNTTVIIDHVAEPLGIGGYSPEVTFPIWAQGMRDLARASDNVNVKLSGLAMCRTGLRFDEQDTPPTSERLADAWGPYFKLCIEAFGVRRCFFASNFPVDKVSCDYTVMWNAFKLIVKDFSTSDKQLLFYENAKRVYRL